MSTFAERRTVIPPLPPTTPRVRLGVIQARGAPLDGAWWPRSGDPVAELPGLILAIDNRRGVGLITAICADRLRVDLLLVPPPTNAAVAQAAMALAAAPNNSLRSPDVLAAALAGLTARASGTAQTG